MRIGEAAKVLGISVQTLRNWERFGKIPNRKCLITGQRHYDKDDIDHIKALMGRGVKHSYADTAYKGQVVQAKARQSKTKIPFAPVNPPLYKWEHLYELNDSEFRDSYPSNTTEELIRINKEAPDYIVPHLQRARSATTRPDENSTMSMGIMPPAGG